MNAMESSEYPDGGTARFRTVVVFELRNSTVFKRARHTSCDTLRSETNLRSHPHVARAYENEKRRAQSLHAEDSHAYSDEKVGWIQEVEAKALVWFNEHPGRIG